jgi:hypothetical protein
LTTAKGGKGLRLGGAGKQAHTGSVFDEPTEPEAPTRRDAPEAAPAADSQTAPQTPQAAPAARNRRPAARRSSPAGPSAQSAAQPQAAAPPAAVPGPAGDPQLAALQARLDADRAARVSGPAGTPWRPPPQPAYQPPPADVLSAHLRYALRTTGLAWAAAAKKADERWSEYARVVAEARSLPVPPEVLEPVLERLAAEIGAPLPEDAPPPA